MWVEIDEGGESMRLGGSSQTEFLPPDVEPTTTLVAAAHDQRELNVGNVLGDLRIAGDDDTRWEFYSAPCRIELSPALRHRLTGRWVPRGPA